MGLLETVIEGTLKPDGTLELDQKPRLLPGRITVVLRQEEQLVFPKDDPFWERMQAMWSIPVRATDGGEATLAEVRALREEWDEH